MFCLLSVGKASHQEISEKLKEATFNMLKRKFDGKLFSKNEPAQVNEALVKVLCHNIVVLIHESFENKIPIDILAASNKLRLFNSINVA